MAYPEPTEVAPWYLRNITQALALDTNSGNVYVRTDATLGNVTITGNVNIPGNINANVYRMGNVDLSGNTLPVNVVGNVAVTQGTTPWVVTGNTNVAITSGNVGITGNIAGITSNVNVNPITGNVNANVTGTVNANIIGGNVSVTGNVGVTSLGNVVLTGNALPVTGNVGITGNANVILANDANVVISAFSGPTADAFGRLRVSNPYTLFDTQARYYDHKQFASSTAGAGNVTYQANSSTFLCSVGTASGDSVLRETVKPFPYQPGKSLLVYQSFCMTTPKANLRQRVGFFSAQNGVFFEADGTTLNMVIRSYSSGAIVEDRIPQSQWNINSLSNSIGVNPSGIVLNPALDQIWFCDIEWLGVGTVRVGFIIDGAYVECHHFNHANTPSTGTANNTTTYMTTASLPLRLEITNTGTTASASTLLQICSSVISEGGFQLTGSGNPRAASHVISSPVTLPNDQSFKPVISIRLKSTMLDAVVVPIDFSLVPVQQSIFQYRIYKKAITTGGTWTDSAADSAVQYNLSPTTLVSGDIAEESFINSTNQSSSAPTQENFGFEFQLERDPFTGTPYEYVITMATTGNGQTVYAGINWQEIT